MYRIPFVGDAAAMLGAVRANRYASIDNRIVGDARDAGGGRMPAVSGFDLDGRRLDLPTDLGPGPTVAVVAYHRWHQSDVDTWLPFLDDLQRRTPSLRVYEFPTVRPMGKLGQEWLDGVMRSAIPDPVARQRTVTLYVDVDDFNAATGLPGTDRIHVLVVDRHGGIVWWTSGPFDPTAAVGLEQAVTDLVAG